MYYLTRYSPDKGAICSLYPSPSVNQLTREAM